MLNRKNATCSYIDTGGYGSWPIGKCLFIDYIKQHLLYVTSHEILGPNEGPCRNGDIDIF